MTQVTCRKAEALSIVLRCGNTAGGAERRAALVARGI
ncbi:hypothetical protein FHS53_002175 [Xanthobacter tagetidis]|jgi:hypothetical protein|nr:hypothetical protein [Xanthobacter tagetidis]